MAKETAAQKRARMRGMICGRCMEPIDESELRDARLLGKDYMHGCGRWLVRGGNAEVPTRSDGVSNDSYDDYFDTRYRSE